MDPVQESSKELGIYPKDAGSVLNRDLSDEILCLGRGGERDWRKGQEVSSFPIAAVTSDHTSGA